MQSQEENYKVSIKRFDDFALEYADRFMNIESYRPSVDQFCDLIKSNIPFILELACGPGNVTKYVKNRLPTCQFTAIDLAPKMIDIARKQVKGVDFRVMDVREINSLKTQFDAIMCAFCLPFLSKRDSEKLIADCALRLKKDGVLYISTMEGDETRAGFEKTNFSGDSEIYFNYHTQQDLAFALTTNGFLINQIKRQDYFEMDGSVTTDMIIIATKK